MSPIHLSPDSLICAPALETLLRRRGLLADSPARVEGGAVVAAAATEARATALARSLKATHLVLIDETTSRFAVETRAGGRVLHVGLPQGGPWMALLVGLIAAVVQPMLAADPASLRLLQTARRVARSDVSVLISGPSGTGKEVLAREIHDHSARANKAFVAINCAAIPEAMLESVLFGHEKGAFTGAGSAAQGLIRAADGGTLLLDEITEMALPLQAKLLRVLQERAVLPLGAHREVPVNLRILATSNRDLPAEVAARRFREDLFYRLNVFPLATIALDDRPGDIPALVAALLLRHAPGPQVPMPDAAALAALTAHGWAGNVRELENVLQRALVLCEGATITEADLLFDTPAPVPMTRPAMPSLALAV